MNNSRSQKMMAMISPELFSIQIEKAGSQKKVKFDLPGHRFRM